MRSLNTARLYARGHELFKKSVHQLHSIVQEALENKDFLFLGCAKVALFFDGSFYQARDPQFNNFLKFFHALGISHLLFDKKVTLEELEAFMTILAGAQQDQGAEINGALRRENIRNVGIGVLDYSIFATAQNVASQFALAGDDESVWQQLIIQPATVGILNLSPEKIKELNRLSQDLEGLKKLLLRLDQDLRDKQHGISLPQRGLLIANFLENMERTLARTEPQRGKDLAREVHLVLDTLEPALRIQILGAIPPDESKGEASGLIHEVIEATSQKQLIYILIDALAEDGATSPCFNNLFSRTIARYKDIGLLLSQVRSEMHQATQERRPGTLNAWQHLEQLIIQRQEIEEFNVRYQKEIEALAKSIHIEAPLVAEQEMARLHKTLLPESLAVFRSRLIIDLLNFPHSKKQFEMFSSPLLEALGRIMEGYLNDKRFNRIGNLLRYLFLVMKNIPKDVPVMQIIHSWFTTEEVHALLESLYKNCRTYDSKEMSSISATCQLYSDKAAGFLIDLYLKMENQDNSQTRWILTTLAGIAPSLARPLTQKIQSASENDLPQLIALAEMASDKHMAPAVEALIDHKDQMIRSLAVRAIGHLQAEKSVPRLAQIITDKSWLGGKKLKALQTDAVQALADIGTEEALAVLENLAKERTGDLAKLCKEILQSSGGTDA